MYNILGDIMNVREELFKNQDEKYGDFHSKLIPNIDRDKIIGVRLPNIRKIAKASAKEKAFADTFYYEEKMVKGMVIEYNRKLSLKQRLSLLDEFVPLIEIGQFAIVVRQPINSLLKILTKFLNIFLNIKTAVSMKYALCAL